MLKLVFKLCRFKCAFVNFIIDLSLQADIKMTKACKQANLLHSRNPVWQSGQHRKQLEVSTFRNVVASNLQNLFTQNICQFIMHHYKFVILTFYIMISIYCLFFLQIFLFACYSMLHKKDFFVSKTVNTDPI